MATASNDGRAATRGAPTHICCPDCGLRFTPAAATYLVACPQCGQPPQPMPDLVAAVGFRLFKVEDAPLALPEAIAVSMPDPGGGRS